MLIYSVSNTFLRLRMYTLNIGTRKHGHDEQNEDLPGPAVQID